MDAFHDTGSGRFPLRPTLDQGAQRFRPPIVVSGQARNGQLLTVRSRNIVGIQWGGPL